jgi:hypothetical protein
MHHQIDGAEHEEACRWCGLAMTTLVDLDLTNPLTGFLGLKGSRLRISTCEFCSPFDRTILTNVDLTGKSTWHESNEKPEYLREPSGERFPAKRLRLGRTERHWLESVSWLLPGVSFSQVGGHPTWIGGAAYPPCPQCEELMPFVGQFSVADVEKFGEGIYSMFLCDDCGIAATGYQQSWIHRNITEIPNDAE